jgi:hypothetical protein
MVHFFLGRGGEVVFEGPVWSGPSRGFETGLHRFKNPKRPVRTDINRSSAVFCGLLRSFAVLQPVSTGLFPKKKIYIF